MRSSNHAVLWLVVAALLSCPTVASATTVTGTIKNPDGSGINGLIEFQLSQAATTSGPPFLFVPEKVTCAVTAGVIQSCIVQGNDTLSPTGTFYKTTIRDSNNRKLGKTVNYSITGASVDIGSLTILADGTIQLPDGSVVGDLTVTGDATISGSLTASSGITWTAPLNVTGTAPGSIQHKITGAAAQTADILVVENSGGTDYFNVAANGDLAAPGSRFNFGTPATANQNYHVRYETFGNVAPFAWTIGGSDNGGTFNDVLYYGYNCQNGNSKIVSSAARLCWTLEADFFSGGVHTMEWNFDWANPAGTASTRPLAFTIDLDSVDRMVWWFRITGNSGTGGQFIITDETGSNTLFNVVPNGTSSSSLTNVNQIDPNGAGTGTMFWALTNHQMSGDKPFKIVGGGSTATAFQVVGQTNQVNLHRLIGDTGGGQGTVFNVTNGGVITFGPPSATDVNFYRSAANIIKTDDGLEVSKALWAGLSTVTFSATPTFDASLGNTQKITLTGNVTSSTLSNASNGQPLYFIICQDGTGSHTFVWPTNVKGGMTIGSTASTCSAQSFIFDGANAFATSTGSTGM